MTWIPFYGLRIKDLNNSWYMVWPIIQKHVVIDIMTQTVDLRCQSIFTKDLRDITVSGAIRYYISNPRKAILNTQDYDKNIETVALGIIQDFVGERTLEECNDREALKREILIGIRDEAADWGLKIQKVYITDMGRAKNIRLLTNALGG